MGRPWDYPNGRRVMMQVAMWLVLGGTIGLAQIVVRSRGIDRAPQVRVGRFLVRVPFGFALDTEPSSKGMRAHDANGDRELFIMAFPMSARPESIDGRAPHALFGIHFEGLNCDGTWRIARQMTTSPEGEEIERTALIATVAVPSAGAKLVVGLVLGSGQETGADSSLLRSFADGITLAAPEPVAPPGDLPTVFNHRAPGPWAVNYRTLGAL